MPLYKALQPVSYVNGDGKVVHIVHIGTIFLATEGQAATIPSSSIEYVGSGSSGGDYAPRATFLVYDNAASFPSMGSDHHVYLTKDTGELFRWNEAAQTYFNIDIANVAAIVTSDLESRNVQLVAGTTPGTVQWQAGDAIGPEFPGNTVLVDGISDAGTIGKAVLNAETQAAGRAAIDAASTGDVPAAITAADIPGQVATAIAADGTVVDAAAAAVTTEITGRDLLEGTDERLPRRIDPDGVYTLTEIDEVGRVARFVDLQGRTWIKPHPSLEVGAENISADVPLPLNVATDGTIVFGITDDQDRAAISVTLDGLVNIPKPSPQTLAAFSGTSARVIPEPSWSTQVASWNPEKALYNYHPTALQRWFAALARAMAGTGTAHITAFVDSETYGAAASGASQPKWLNSWPGRLRRQLDILTGYGSGTGVVPLFNILFETPADDPRFTFGSSAVQLTPPGGSAAPHFGVLGRGAVQLTNDTGNGYIEFTPTQDVDRFTIYALADAGATGTATIKVDGALVGSFDVSVAGGGGSIPRRAGLPSNVIVVDAAGLLSGAHTLRIEGPSASTVTVWAVEGDTGQGVRVSNLARSSTNSSSLTLDDTVNHFYGMPLHFDVPAADLSIFMLGLNDRGISSATFVPRVESALARVRAAGGDVLLVCPGQPDYISLPGDLKPRLTDLYGVADDHDVPLLDMAWVRTDFDTADALGLYGDAIHSNDTGLEHHARFIINALTGA